MGYAYEVTVGRMSNLVPIAFSFHDRNRMLQVSVIGKMESRTFSDIFNGLMTRGVREREEVSNSLYELQIYSPCHCCFWCPILILLGPGTINWPTRLIVCWGRWRDPLST